MSTAPMGPSDAPIAATPAQMGGRRASRAIPWRLVSLLGRGGGFLLLFVGTLVDVVAGSYPADCFTSHCGGGASASVQYGILAARILWSVGAFALSGGAAIDLHFVLQGPEANGAEENARFLARRRTAFVLFLVGIAILFGLLITQSGAVAPAL